MKCNKQFYNICNNNASKNFVLGNGGGGVVGEVDNLGLQYPKTMILGTIRIIKQSTNSVKYRQLLKTDTQNRKGELHIQMFNFFVSWTTLHQSSI